MKVECVLRTERKDNFSWKTIYKVNSLDQVHKHPRNKCMNIRRGASLNGSSSNLLVSFGFHARNQLLTPCYKDNCIYLFSTRQLAG